MSAARKIGYERNILAANFRRQKTKSIAISIADLTNPFFPELIKGFKTRSENMGTALFNLTMNGIQKLSKITLNT